MQDLLADLAHTVVTFCRRESGRKSGTATTRELATVDEPSRSGALGDRVLPVALEATTTHAAAWVVTPDDALVLAARGVPGWRITVRVDGPDEHVLDASVRSYAAFVRGAPDGVARAVALCAYPGVDSVASVEVDGVAEASAAVAAGARDLVIGDWTADEVGALRSVLTDVRLIERSAFPVGLEIADARTGLDAPVLKAYLDQVDASGAARPRTEWAPGKEMPPPVPRGRLSAEWEDEQWRAGAPEDDLDRIDPAMAGVLERSLGGVPPTRDEVEALFRARGAEVEVIAKVADTLRERTCGDTVTYVVNRNINYTNQCYFKCGFCGFSRGPKSLQFRDEPYVLEIHEVVHRSVEAWERGATEVCLVGGIRPDFDGDFYAGVLEAVKRRLPKMHVHGFTPLEVWQGAETLGVSVRDFLTRLRDSGLGTLPGTAAEILDDEVREHLCPDKIRTAEWAYVCTTAHELGLRMTSTIMFGHIDGPRAYANHFEILRQIQRRTGGFTEFVPLPFVHMGAPMYLQGRSRPGPTWDEVVLIHALSRIAFDGLIPNIQASWVKLGLPGGARLLDAGCNDLGGTLMNESISRASGAKHGQLATPEELEDAIRGMGRVPARRNTVYELLETAPH